jgi:tetratricopeptide (TPR) repeat protein
VLFEMIAGRRAFAGSAATILDAKQNLEFVTLGPAEAPPELAQVVARATSRDAAARYPSAAALGRALAPWVHAGRAATQPHRPAELTGVRTVYVVGTRGSDRPGLYLANAVHEQVLARLRRIPLVRVVARYGELTEPLDDDSIVVSIDAHDQIEVTVAGVKVAVPVHIDQVTPAVEVAVRAFETVLHHENQPQTASDVEDLLLRARHMLMDNVREAPRAMAMLERAHEMSPHEPRITANLAIAHVRMAFFLGDTQITSLARATELSKRAVQEAPQLADSHIAAAHVALNTGDSVAAAVHFRTAIACAPHLSEPHEQLGRLLLEAGFIDTALARLEETLRVAAGPRMVRWDIGRAWALDGRWADYEALEAELVAEGHDRPMSRVRYLWWKRDLAALAEFRAWFEKTGPTALAPATLRALFRVYLDGEYAEARELLVGQFEAETRNRRRRAFVGQMAAEAAAFAGDLETAIDLVERSYDAGFFDLHWLEKCPLLDGMRADPRYPPLHAKVKARAEAILDALYGDQGGVATQDTALATS